MQSEFDPGQREAELSLADAINLATRRIATAVIVAGAAIGLGIWARPSPPHYQAFVTPTGIVRVNGRSGTVILCEPGKRCRIVLRKGQHLEGGGHSFSFDFADKKPEVAAPATPAPKALPAPAPAPAVPPAAN